MCVNSGSIVCLFQFLCCWKVVSSPEIWTAENSILTANLSLIKAVITSDFCSTSVWALVKLNVFEVFETLCSNMWYLVLHFPFLSTGTM